MTLLFGFVKQSSKHIVERLAGFLHRIQSLPVLIRHANIRAVIGHTGPCGYNIIRIPNLTHFHKGNIYNITMLHTGVWG